MSWLPSPPRVLILIQQIEKRENLLQGSSELFWLFCTQSMSPENFHERTIWWINKHLEDAPKGGGFIDPEIRDYILQGPEKLAKLIEDKLDNLSVKMHVPYHPDENDDPISLYVYLHIEASRLNQFLKSEKYSERTQESLDNALNAFQRCKQAQELLDPRISAIDKISLYLVGSFLYFTDFGLKKTEGTYEDAILSISEAITCLQEVHGIYTAPNTLRRMELEPASDDFDIRKNSQVMQYLPHNEDIRTSLPWVQSLKTQEIVDCFEALRASGSCKDTKTLIDIADILSFTSEELWPSEDEYAIRDAAGCYWVTEEYWQHMSGWLEAQLQPSEFKKLSSSARMSQLKND